MAEYIREYSPAKTTLTYAGILTFKGVAEGTFFEMARNNPRTDVTVGAKGDPAITRTADRTGTVTVTLLQNSPTNQYLSNIVSTEDVEDKLFRADIVASDPSGGVVAVAKRCHIQEPAPIVLGDGQNAKVWTFYSEDVSYLTVPEGLTEIVADAQEVVSAISAVSDNYSTVTN